MHFSMLHVLWLVILHKLGGSHSTQKEVQLQWLPHATGWWLYAAWHLVTSPHVSIVLYYIRLHKEYHTAHCLKVAVKTQMCWPEPGGNMSVFSQKGS